MAYRPAVLDPAAGGTGVANGALTITLASGASGKLLTSDSSGNATWQAAPSGGITTIDGNSGSVTGSTVTISASGSSSVAFTGSSTTLSLTLLDGSSNLCLGGTAAGAANVFLGNSFNVGGSPASNVGIGEQFFRNLGGSAAANVAIGLNALGQLTTGSYNIAIGGNDPGYNYSGSESYNILLGNEGVNAESNVLRIGSGTGTSAYNLNKAFIAGINGRTPSGTLGVVINDNNDQLGTQANLSIALGGTNAGSFTQSQGIVVYNGTRLVNYAGPRLSSAGVYTNTSQPCFLVHLVLSTAGITGDGTFASIQFDTTTFDQASNITLNSSGKTIFTAPVTGKYRFEASLDVLGGIAGNVFYQFNMIATSREFSSNGNLFSITGTAGAQLLTHAIIDMSANDTVYLQLYVSGSGTKNVSLNGSGSATTVDTWWCGSLIC